MNEYLLQQLADLVGATYISDLHNQFYWPNICTALQSLTPGHYSLKEWTDAVHYLLNDHETSFDTPVSACQYLQRELKREP